MRRYLIFLALGVLAAWLTGCTSQIVRVPLTPYVAGDLKNSPVRRVAVLPVVVPDYLMDKGGEVVSVELTNQFMTELAAKRLFDLVGGDQVTEAMTASYGNLREWVFQGNLSSAVKIARELKTEGVIFGQVKRFVQSHLDQAEFEVQFELVEIGSLETLWSVRELMIGKGGSPALNEPVTAPPTNVLSERGVQGAAERIGQIYETGGKIEVSQTSPRMIWGYSLLSAGAVTTVAAVYYLTMSSQAYRKYGSADSAADLSRYQDDTKEYDQMWEILGPIGLGLIGGGTYLLLTDPARQYAERETAPVRFALMPVVTPTRYGVGCYARF